MMLGRSTAHRGFILSLFIGGFIPWGGRLQASPTQPAAAAHAPGPETAPIDPADEIFSTPVNDSDPVRYGGSAKDAPLPDQCAGDACEITVIEYSDFQCPFCRKGQATAKQLLNKYRGRIRWIVRDAPLPFHDRAKPAAIAAFCAKVQGKYWQMHDALYKSQSDLSDEALRRLAASQGLNMEKFADCLAHPQVAEDHIKANLSSGAALGVSGTPTYFVNGHRLTGALPFGEFKRVIESSLQE